MGTQKLIFRTVRGKDLRIRYTQDNSQEILINQRQFYDGNGVILSPITSKLLEREVLVDNPLPQSKAFTPRRVVSCFASKNISGKSEFSTIIPYCPGDINHKLQIQELTNYVSHSQNLDPPRPLNLMYYGENRNY